jgi:hypothetical protein
MKKIKQLKTQYEKAYKFRFYPNSEQITLLERLSISLVVLVLYIIKPWLILLNILNNILIPSLMILVIN